MLGKKGSERIQNSRNLTAPGPHTRKENKAFFFYF
jgi:hypothetical protein